MGCPAECTWKNKWSSGKPLNTCMRYKSEHTSFSDPLHIYGKWGQLTSHFEM